MSEMIERVVGGNIVREWPPIIPPTPTPQELTLLQIQQLEREQLMPRITRETILRLAEQEAAELGLTIEQLIAKNKGYRSLKQFDDYIATLRAQL